MSNRERGLLIIAGLLALVTLPWWPIWGDGTAVNDLGLEESSIEAFESLKRARNTMPELHLELLDLEKEPFAGATRNLFRFGESTAENDFVEEDPDEYEDDPVDTGDPMLLENPVEVEQQPVDRKPRLTGYECIGIYASGESSHAVIQWQDQLFVARKDMVVNNVFRIESIDQQSVTIFVLEGEYRQKLKISAPAGQ